MANAVSTTSFDALSRHRLDMFVDSAEAYDDAAFEAAGEQATALVLSACRNAGYNVTAAVSDPVVIRMASMVAVRDAFNANGLETPDSVADIDTQLSDLAAGRLPLTSIEPDQAEGQGGSAWTDTSASADRPAVMRNLRDVYR